MSQLRPFYLNTLFLAGLWFSASCLGAPTTQIFPQINALDVTSDVESNELRTTLHATNHERSAVICDAEMKTNLQETQRKSETRIEPGKTADFPFSHRRSVKDIKIYLMCVQAESHTPSPHDDTKSGSQSSPPSQPAPVTVENLDAH